jgi:hypothetical protein
MRLRGATLLLPLAAAAAPPAGFAAALSQTAPAPIFQGTWDLQWKTRRGLTPGGYMVIRQKGARFKAKLHGQGSIEASGSLNGDRFVLRGSRLLVPYTMTGTLRGDTIEGSLKVMSVERHFIGRRRR